MVVVVVVAWLPLGEAFPCPGREGEHRLVKGLVPSWAWAWVWGQCHFHVGSGQCLDIAKPVKQPPLVVVVVVRIPRRDS